MEIIDLDKLTSVGILKEENKKRVWKGEKPSY